MRRTDASSGAAFGRSSQDMGALADKAGIGKQKKGAPEGERGAERPAPVTEVAATFPEKRATL